MPNCLATTNVLERRGLVRWLVRRTPQHPEDTGWRVMSHRDTTDYLNAAGTWRMVSVDEISAIESALTGIWDMPIGSDIQILRDERGVRIIDTPTGWELSQDPRDVDDDTLSAAVVEAIGDIAAPHVDKDELVERYGAERGEQLAVLVLGLVREASAMPIEWGDMTLLQGVNDIMARFRTLHPGLSVDALQEIGRCVGWMWR